MSVKSQRAQAKLPPNITLREFLRKGYKNSIEPTQVTYHSRVLGTWIPGSIEEDYSWTPGVAPRSSSVPKISDPRTHILKPSTEIPDWLKPKTPTKRHPNQAR